MSELAERFEVLVETFARKIAALAIDAAEQKGRADKAEAEVERLQREYVPGHPANRDAAMDAPVLDDERKELCDEINKWKSRYFLVADNIAAESESAEQLADVAYKTRQKLAAEKKRADEAEAKLRTFLSEETRLVCEDLRREESAHAATTAKLGRAVAALQATANRLGCRVGLRDDCKVANGRQCYGCETLDVFDAILADADGTQAAEALRELEAVVSIALKIRERQPLWQSAALGPNSEILRDLYQTLAAVDARRGK